MIEVRFNTKAKEDCLKGGLPIDYLRKAIIAEMEGKIMQSLNDDLYISVIYGKRPIMAIGRQYEDLFLVNEVNFEFTLIHATESGGSVVHKPEYKESEEYLALKEITDREELLVAPIDQLDLNVRILGRLYKAELRIIGDVINKSEDYYRDNKILPPSNLAELKGRLLGLNLEFRNSVDILLENNGIDTES